NRRPVVHSVDAQNSVHFELILALISGTGAVLYIQATDYEVDIHRRCSLRIRIACTEHNLVRRARERSRFHAIDFPICKPTPIRVDSRVSRPVVNRGGGARFQPIQSYTGPATWQASVNLGRAEPGEKQIANHGHSL